MSQHLGRVGSNAFRDGLTASINGETMTHARQMLLCRAPPRDDVPCTTCEMAIEWEASGRRDDAASVYRRILTALPGHAEAARRLGVLGEG